MKKRVFGFQEIKTFEEAKFSITGQLINLIF